MGNWLYNNKEVTEDNIPEGSIGFVYVIRHIPTEKYYIGKKTLSSIRNVRLGKRELQQIKEERKKVGMSGRLPSKKRVSKYNNWKEYYSSNEIIKEMVSAGKADEFERSIIRFCNSRKSLSYYEIKYQILHNVLEDDNSWNENIGGKYFKRDLI
jgi:hypothetical protein